MTKKHNILTLGFAIIFGIMIGILGLSILAWKGGFLEWNAERAASNVSQSSTPGMELLNSHQCHKAETKHIILRGIEDRFSPKGDEFTSDNARKKRLLSRADGLISVRDYDELGMDKQLIDSFTAPAGTVNGIVVTRLKPLSSLANDGFRLGRMWMPNVSPEAYVDLRDDYHIGGDELLSMKGWNRDGDVVWKPLSELDMPYFFTTPREASYPDILSYIRDGKGERPLQLVVSDDTAVDFFGIAICVEPNERKGTTHFTQEITGAQNLTHMLCDAPGNSLCNPYTGDLLCSEKRPVACFHDALAPPPDIIAKNSTIRHAWSGGELKLTSEVQGDKFQTVENVTAYCRAQFGLNWRALSHHDGHMSAGIIGRGNIQPNTEAWIHVNGGVYANCWKQRPDYKEVETGSD